MTEEKVLDVIDLSTTFHKKKKVIHAIDGVSFSLNKGEMLGIVGESGCGKSVTSQSILRLYDEETEVSYSGNVMIDGQDIMQLSKKQMEEIRGRKIAMIFQDALSSLNPVFTIGSQMIEAIRVHHKISKKEAKQQAIGILKKVGISEPEKRMKQYTHELSGGMRQRVMIAIALCCSPQVLIADEPTTALDVTIQAQIMDLIAEIKEREQMGVILITHDMAVVAENCDRVAVMYLGQVVEEASVDEIFAHPMHPYTKGLMKSIPRMTGDREKDLYMIEGTLPVLDEIKEGCRFASRCPYANEKCKEQEAEFKEVSKEHYVRCFYPQTSEGDLKHE